MKKSYTVLVFAFLVFLGCGKEKNITAPGETQKTGTIAVNVTWPEGVAGKEANILREPPDRITAYLYLSGKEIIHSDLAHVGSRGTAELKVVAMNGYRLEIIALNDRYNQVLYTGFKDSIIVYADTVTTVDITMYDAAPILYPAQKTGDTSYIISWSHVPLATSYMLEESESSRFSSGGFIPHKLSTTVYTGPDTTKTLTGKEIRIYYYTVFAVTQYGKNYPTTSSDLGDYDFDDAVQYGAMSNIVSVASGPSGSGTLKIDIPWPTK